MEYIAKICPNNCEKEINRVKEKLRQLPDIEIVDDFCVLYCGQCLVQPFTLLNGKNIAADNAEELLEKIVTHMEEAKAKC
ncbi:DUF1450 domain-containing protein [Aneurinibacillus aneurinilyticus]|jgi:uncharacterized protein YuzB (UPF0349 family)|uniref:DUF1450 domain-containing protein n=1 Tax=Aneurinibacillus aneurinilyticus ATCC 12856 TaxID=649747 RepID=U1YBS5_ANEAE|nr:DUF1450 domain-containing protein [Aneurinibacillus aneurinilyticus]ERI09557.1 hypothetical protein HMPREF0083_02398 [Aneurinibacillus aneurinilyticus ATCC 12856]MCI1695746.1 YuzB family protein [Aneurinibacillus aneurinilyticus]MED0706719.1 DUF1450 domain-containing protein [Aneurinibacillus aneurinilyticus]MED0722593.1 DUF1450 domain-containing protein [Aneurinibacillus aneurinilyticus]MED0734701.1 DUF1450 domain-containing protein [Aneurinibacillus aneurinilyticus]